MKFSAKRNEKHEFQLSSTSACDMLHDFRIFVLLVIIIVIKLSGQLTTAAWKPPKKLDLNNWKKEKVKDPDFHCVLDLTPEQKEWLYEPESSFDEATGALDVPKKQTNFRGKAFDVFHWPKSKDGYVLVPYLIPRGSKFCKFSTLSSSLNSQIHSNFTNFILNFSSKQFTSDS